MYGSPPPSYGTSPAYNPYPTSSVPMTGYNPPVYGMPQPYGQPGYGYQQPQQQPPIYTQPPPMMPSIQSGIKS